MNFDGIKQRLKGELKAIEQTLGKDIMLRIDGAFSYTLMEILIIAFLFDYKSTRPEVLRDIIYKYIDDNAYKISHAGNDSVVKFRERLMLALDLNKEINKWLTTCT